MTLVRRSDSNQHQYKYSLLFSILMIYLWVKVELDGVPNIGSDFIWTERQITTLAESDDVI